MMKSVTLIGVRKNAVEGVRQIPIATFQLGNKLPFAKHTNLLFEEVDKWPVGCFDTSRLDHIRSILQDEVPRERK